MSLVFEEDVVRRQNVYHNVCPRCHNYGSLEEKQYFKCKNCGPLNFTNPHKPHEFDYKVKCPVCNGPRYVEMSIVCAKCRAMYDAYLKPIAFAKSKSTSDDYTKPTTRGCLSNATLFVLVVGGMILATHWLL